MAKYIDDPELLAQLNGDTDGKKYVTDKLLLASLNGGGGKPKAEPSTMERIGQGFITQAQGLRDVAAGGIRGAGSIGRTLLTGADLASELSPLTIAKNLAGGKYKDGYLKNTFDRVMKDDAEGRGGMDGGLQELGADTNSIGYKGGKLAGEIAGTSGMGGLVANGVRAAAPALAASRYGAPLVDAIATSGMKAGGMTGAQSMLPRIAGGAITGGAASGAIDPSQTGMGAAIGGALPVGISGIGKAGQLIGSAFKGAPAVDQDLARMAIEKYQIPLGASDVSGSTSAKALRSVLNDAPFIGRVGDAQKAAIQSGYNKAVGGTFGADANKLTPDVIDAAKARMGSEFDRIWNNNVLKVDAPMMQSMAELEKQAAKLPRNEGDSIRAELKDLYSKMNQSEMGDVVIDGQTANKFQSYLRRRAESSSGLKNELGDLRQNIISTFNRSVSADDAAALALNRSQYKAFKTVEPLLNKGEAGVAGREAGDVPASLLPNAVAQSYSRAAGVPLADVSKIGSQFLVDRVARTGGSTRAAIQNSAIGGALGFGAMSNPWALGAVPLAYGANRMLGSPALAKRMLNGGLLGAAPEGAEQLGYRTMPMLIGQNRGE